MQHTAPSEIETSDCACAALYRDGKFLLARRSPRKRFYPGAWDIPGGHVRLGESVEAALAREILEEIGVIPTTYCLAQVLRERNPATHGEHRYNVFIVTKWSGGEPRLNNDEHTEIRWCSADEASQLGLADDRYLDLFRLIATQFEMPTNRCDGPSACT